MSEQLLSNSIERTIAELEAENARLRQQLAEAQARADTLLQQRNYAVKSASEWGDLALLAQQQAKTQAGQWQPVEDGAFCHDIIDGFSALEVEGGQIVSIRHVSNLDGEAVQLIHDMGDLRLCRRVEPEWLDQPNREGWWAFEGSILGHSSEKEVYLARGNPLYASGRDGAYELSYMSGKWQRLHIAWPEVSE